jgi:hypothetical protein
MAPKALFFGKWQKWKQNGNCGAASRKMMLDANAARP